MKPPEAPTHGSTAADGDAPPAVLSCPQPASVGLITLRQRVDFQRCTRAKSAAMPAFILQMRKRRDDEDPPRCAIRIGFTCSKKVGNAVARNRAKRRLREIARLGLPQHGCAGHDYVLVGRKDVTANLPFTTLQTQLVQALHKLHAGSK